MKSSKRKTNPVSGYNWCLGSPSWRELREYVMRRANDTCERCGSRPATEVHHLTYVRVFRELPSDLIAICRQCHAEIHWRQPANDNLIQFTFDFPEAPEDDPEEGQPDCRSETISRAVHARAIAGGTRRQRRFRRLRRQLPPNPLPEPYTSATSVNRGVVDI